MAHSTRLPSTRPTTRRERIKRNKILKSRDTIFSDQNSPTEFKFNSKVAEVFDDMLERSIPLYHECQNLTIEWCKRLAKPNTSLYDLGCSTGALLLPIAQSNINIPGFQLIGVDSSRAMLNKANEKLGSLSSSVQLIEADLNKAFPFKENCATVMNYTLQFISQENRLNLVRQIYNSLIPGGGLIINEKILGENEELNSSFIELHNSFKEHHGYSKMEISKKRDALENVLFPSKVSSTIELLHSSGFNLVDLFFKWNNFAGLIALK